MIFRYFTNIDNQIEDLKMIFRGLLRFGPEAIRKVALYFDPIAAHKYLDESKIPPEGLYSEDPVHPNVILWLSSF